jgi:hypothetical protein
VGLWDDEEITALQMYFHLLEGPVQEVQLKEIFGQYLQ